jgi:hypothetical protein
MTPSQSIYATTVHDAPSASRPTTSEMNAANAMFDAKQFQRAQTQYQASIATTRHTYENNMRAMHVVGYMDYDPKAGARNAFKPSSATIRRESSGWFH